MTGVQTCALPIYQSEEAQDPEDKEHKALEKHLEAEQDNAQVMQASCSSNVFKEVPVANNLLVF